MKDRVTALGKSFVDFSSVYNVLLYYQLLLLVPGLLQVIVIKIIIGYIIFIQIYGKFIENFVNMLYGRGIKLVCMFSFMWLYSSAEMCQGSRKIFY